MDVELSAQLHSGKLSLRKKPVRLFASILPMYAYRRPFVSFPVAEIVWLSRGRVLTLFCIL